MRKFILIASALLTAAVNFSTNAQTTRSNIGLTSDRSAEYICVDAIDNECALRTPGDEGPYKDPQGEKIMYLRSTHAIAPILWFLYDSDITGAVGTAVFAEDNVVYLNSIVNNILGLGYIKGIIDDDKVITFEFPQYLGSINGNRLDIYCMTNLGNDEYGWCLGADISTNQTYKMKIAEDGTITPLPEYEETILGWSSDGINFDGYGDYGYRFVPQTDSPITLPTTADVMVSTWANETMGFFGKMAIDGDDLYVQHMFPLMPESWVKCTKSGDGYRFESGQLLGICVPGHSHDYWCYGYAADYDEIDDPELGEMTTLTILESMNLTPEGENVHRANKCVYNGPIMDIGYSGFTFDTPSGICTLSARDNEHTLLTPKAPEIESYSIFNYDSDNATSYAYFHQPMYSSDGLLINPDDLFYEVYADGELYTFTHEEFPAIPEEGWTLIPYTFNDGNDMIINSYVWWSDIHQFDIKGVFKQIGIRSVCKVGDEVRYSEMAYASPEGVESVIGESEVASETLTNLAGVKVANPGPGVYVRTIKYTDGSVYSTKVLLK